MPKKALAILVFNCLVFYLSAQDRYQSSTEFGICVGTQVYYGELNKKLSHVRSPGYGAYFRYNINRRVGLNFGLWQGRVEGADSNATDLRAINRNLSFRNTLTEVSAVLEINYFDYQISNREYPYTPYLFLGFAGFVSNPQGKVAGTDDWVDLRTIGTEGQNLDDGQPYKKINFAVPFGIGFRANMFKGSAISVFLGARKTFTDYIDDVSSFYVDEQLFASEDQQFVNNSKSNDSGFSSQEGTLRGDPSTNDWYFIGGFMLNIKLNKKRATCPKWYLN